MNARQEVSALIRAADGGTTTALLRLAELFDEHVKDCPHVEPPVARPAFRAEFRIGPGDVVARDYRPISHDEQVMVDEAEALRSIRGVWGLDREARASAALDGDTQSVRDDS